MSYRALKLLQQEPEISQRDMATRMGISVGKTNVSIHGVALNLGLQR